MMARWFLCESVVEVYKRCLTVVVELLALTTPSLPFHSDDTSLQRPPDFQLLLSREQVRAMDFSRAHEIIHRQLKAGRLFSPMDFKSLVIYSANNHGLSNYCVFERERRGQLKDLSGHLQMYCPIRVRARGLQ